MASCAGSIRWRGGDITDAAFRADLGAFDLIYSLESIQYMPVPHVLDWIVEMLAPRGRFVAIFPYDRPIVQRTADRFDGRYVPPSLAAVIDWADRTPDLDWAFRGLRFREDQRIAAYELSTWSRRSPSDPAPNRIQLVLQKPA